MRNLLVATALTAGFGLVGMSEAQALPFIDGGLSLSDGGVTVPTVPPASHSIVSALTTITQGNPNIDSFSGAFTGATTPTTAATLVLAPIASGSYSVTVVPPVGGDVFTFLVTGATAIISNPLQVPNPANPTLLSDGLEADLSGTVTDSLGLFMKTEWSGEWTASGSCQGTLVGGCTSNLVASYALSLTATGTAPPVPEPASIALLGVGLLGLGFVASRKRSN